MRVCKCVCAYKSISVSISVAVAVAVAGAGRRRDFDREGCGAVPVDAAHLVKLSKAAARVKEIVDATVVTGAIDSGTSS